MKKSMIRHPRDWQRVYFDKTKNSFYANWRIIKKKYNVHAIIKFSVSDFKLINRKIKKLTHFNIHYVNHAPGRNYVIVKIDNYGFFDGKRYKPAIINNKNFILVKCLSIRNNLDYSDLNHNVFKNSLCNIKNIDDLKKAMKRRYKKSLAHLSDSEKLSLGIAITELKIIKRFSQI